MSFLPGLTSFVKKYDPLTAAVVKNDVKNTNTLLKNDSTMVREGSAGVEWLGNAVGWDGLESFGHHWGEMADRDTKDPSRQIKNGALTAAAIYAGMYGAEYYGAEAAAGEAAGGEAAGAAAGEAGASAGAGAAAGDAAANAGVMGGTAGSGAGAGYSATDAAVGSGAAGSGAAGAGGASGGASAASSPWLKAAESQAVSGVLSSFFGGSGSYGTGTQDQIAMDQWNHYKTYVKPLEISNAEQARDYSSIANKNKAATQAAADVSAKFASARDRLTKSPGFNPNSEAYLRTMADMGMSQASQEATAATGARDKVQALGDAKVTDAISLGKGLAANAQTGLASAATQSAANARQSNLESQQMGQAIGGIVGSKAFQNWAGGLGSSSTTSTPYTDAGMAQQANTYTEAPTGGP